METSCGYTHLVHKHPGALRLPLQARMLHSFHRPLPPRLHLHGHGACERGLCIVIYYLCL